MIEKDILNIWWIRRDLRINDNQALAAASADSPDGAHATVLPLYILDPVFWRKDRIPEKRAGFLLAGLRSLDADLRARGSRLIVRTGRPQEVLTEIMKETGAQALFAEEDYTPYARRRDRAVAGSLPLQLLPGVTVFHPDSVLKADGDPYTVFTPFSRTWRARPQPKPSDLLDAPDFRPLPESVRSEGVPEMPLEAFPRHFPAGEVEAARRLRSFLSGPVYRYHEQRNRPDLNATSGLSPYFHFGMLSPRQAVAHAWDAIHSAPDAQAEKSAETWLNEVIWREFFQGILFHFPFVRGESFRPGYRDLPWENDHGDFEAWKTGQTGYPFIDAAMRQLSATGWMHNRPRMIVASFLVKDLLIDWRWGERWFMQQLIDGDIASNNGGWQWSAGTGTDAAPYFRIFNPVTQSIKFDPDGAYIRRWVPELAKVPAKYIHEPWKMPASVQERADCTIGSDYPERLVDHQWARERALNHYKEEVR